MDHVKKIGATLLLSAISAAFLQMDWKSSPVPVDSRTVGPARAKVAGLSNIIAGVRADERIRQSGTTSIRSRGVRPPDTTDESREISVVRGEPRTVSRHRMSRRGAAGKPEEAWHGGGTTEQATKENPERAAAPPVVFEEARKPVVLSISKEDLEKFSPTQQAAIAGLQEGFKETMGRLSEEDPDSPRYFNQWKQEQRTRDEQLRLTLGWEKFNLLATKAAGDVTAGP